MASPAAIDYTSRRNKAIGIAVSAVFHALLLLLFLFMGLSYQIPPPPEYGIEVDMGGGGGGNNSPATSVPTPAPNGGDITQNIEETVSVPDTKTPTNNPKPTITNTPIDKPQIVETPAVNPNALFQKRNSSGGTGGDGTSKGSGTGGDGDDGNGQGSRNGNGIGNTGGDFFLNGRPVVSKAFPASKSNLNGKVIVDFRADREGNVMYAKAGVKGTTIQDMQIWEECEKAAKRSKFRPKSDAEIEEKGTITYRFVVK
jgi:hypothetical protein